MWERVKRVLYLESEVFPEIELDPKATGQAAIVVIVASILSGIGTGFGANSFVSGFLASLLFTIVSWYLWAAVTLFIGTRIYDGQANMGEMLRVIGYAQAPRAFNFFAFIPIVGWVIPLLTLFWVLAASFMAIREGLDIEVGPTIVTVAVSFILVLIGQGIINIFFLGVGLAT